MKRRRCRCLRLCFFLMLCWCLFSSSGDIFDDDAVVNDTPADSLDSTIKYHAFKALDRRRTGVVYDVPLPESLSGVRATVVRMTSKTLWLKGISIRSFRVPPRTATIPPVRRLIVVYQDLGIRSNTYYRVQNYSLATPVLSLLAYDGNGTNLDFVARGGAIVVSFQEVELPRGMDPAKAKCITFGSRNSERLDERTAKGECSTGNVGHFSVVVPEGEEGVAPPPVASAPPENEGLVPTPAMIMKKKRRKWVVWVLAFAAGAIGLVALSVLAVAIARFVRKKRLEEMGKNADNGMALETIWVSGSKMPAAPMMRTRPVLEDGSPP